MKIIRDRTIVDDDFVHVTDGSEQAAATKPIVPLAEYVKSRETLLARHAAVGVRVPSDKLPSDIPDLQRLALIAIEFPKFTDGRGYSVARMLRQRHAYRGELRAVGWVLRDQLLYLERCGFNAFEMKPGKPLDSGLEAFSEFSVRYQADVDDPRPLYRRR
ncbi:MAG: DUF934 domain-containing protein [Deltaproteobacteria bacterium]|nr:DUF934 domain-containing protein [Deltaproteobacteria bacterium]